MKLKTKIMQIEQIKHIPTRWLAMWRAYQKLEPIHPEGFGFEWAKTPEDYAFWNDIFSGQNPYPDKYPLHEWINEEGAFDFLKKHNCNDITVWPESEFIPQKGEMVEVSADKINYTSPRECFGYDKRLVCPIAVFNDNINSVSFWQYFRKPPSKTDKIAEILTQDATEEIKLNKIKELLK